VLRHRADPEVKEWIQVLTLRYAGMKIVVGRDKLDEVQVGSIIRAFLLITGHSAHRA